VSAIVWKKVVNTQLISTTLSNNGVDRNVYHAKCLIGSHIQKLLDQRVKVLKELETEFLAVSAWTIEKHPGTDCASIEEIGEKMTFFSEVLHCYMIPVLQFWDVQEQYTPSPRLQSSKAQLTSGNPVANTLELGAKKGVSNSQITQPVVWSHPSTDLPW
jgi:hypothetical protein